MSEKLKLFTRGAAYDDGNAVVEWMHDISWANKRCRTRSCLVTKVPSGGFLRSDSYTGAGRLAADDNTAVKTMVD